MAGVHWNAAEWEEAGCARKAVADGFPERGLAACSAAIYPRLAVSAMP